MRLKSLSIIQKIYLAAGFFATALFAIAFFAAAPLVQQIKNDGAALAADKQNIELLYQDWRVLENSRQGNIAKQNELNGLPAILPANEALKFIMLVESIAQNTNNQQEVIALNDAGEDGDGRLLNFQINLRGNFPDLIKFLAYLENAPYYNKINSLQIQRLAAKKPAETNGINTVLKISVYQ